jgi:4'-phosphopantetheinyl transferase
METCASVRECPTTGKSHDTPGNKLARVPYRAVLPDSAVEVWLMPLDVPASDLERYSKLLARDERMRVARFHFERDRLRYTIARGVLRVLLGNHLGLAPAAIEFAQGEHGKPYVASPAAPVHFNLSHCADLAIYAISRTHVPGVDIDRLDRKVDDAALARRYFSAREYAGLQSIAPADRKRAFLTCWTRKEAVVKATGDGLRMALEQIEVTVDPDARPQLLNIPAGNTAGWTLHTVDAGSAHAATVALYRAS